MAGDIIRPSALPDRPNPVASEKVPVDNGVTVGGATIEKLVLAGRPTASQPEAEAGVDSIKAMTPLTTKQAIQAQGDVRFASAAQGALADTAVQPGDLAPVATSGAYNELTGKPTLGTAAAANVTDFATAAQGAKADSAVQPGDLATVATTGDYNDLVNKPSGVVPGDGTVTDAKVANPSNLYNRIIDLPSLKDFGAKGDGATLDNVAIQAAIDSGKAVFCPPGTYLLDLSQNINLEGGATVAALIAKSGMCLYGVPGKTIFKIRNGESTDASPKYFNMIAGNTVINNLHLHGITFDLNGQNNKISPNRNRSATVTISNANPAVVTWTGHGLSINNRVIFNTTGTLPSGLDPKRRYYVKTVINANSFTVSLNPGGTAIATTTAGSGTHTATGGSYNQFNCAALMISGSMATVGADARLTNSKILYCEFINSPGVTCVALGQTNTNAGGGGTGAVLGNNIELAYCRFYNNGLDADDHSSVYMWANNVWLHHNLFDHPVMSSGIEGPYAAFEFHGSHNWFESNTVNNYQWGGYIAGNWTDVSRGQFIINNDFFTAKKGVIAFVNLATEPGMQDVQIRGNRFWLSADFQGEFGFDGSTVKKVIDLRPEYGAMRDVIISGNVIKTFDNYGAYAIDIGCFSASNGISNVKVTNNLISGFAVSIHAGIVGGGSVLDADISDNQIVDARPNTLVPSSLIGIQIVGANGRIRVRDNSFSRASGLVNFGVSISGTMTHLDADGNFGAVSDYSDTSIVQGYRTGRQACTFAAVPTQGTWKFGGYAHLDAPALLGTSPNKYIVFGWQRLTAGTGNVLGTDWAEDRSGSTGL